jgi:defect-in-organelle-trafficking protein DotC
MRTRVGAKIAVALFCAGIVSAVHSQPAAASQAPLSLEDLLKTAPQSPESAGIPAVRFNAIKETAVTYGAQAGLARRSFENKERLEKRANDLDVVYNFQPLMIEGNVLPPVLTETSEVYDQTSDDMLRVIGKVFRIESQARFTYSTPNWRSYMMTGYDFDSNVVAAVAPQNEAEKTLWRQGVEEGFRLGAEQADEILKQNFATLQRDFKGMVLYHKMLDQGLVTKPFVASNRTGIARGADGSMHVGEVFLRITAAPDFVGNSEKWKTGPRSAMAERLRQLADPQEGQALLQEAREAGVVREKGR